jgi:5-methyltetrahydrofolate--homocysteine methyltransferase
VVHVLDASRAVPVTTSLLSDDGKAEFVAQHRAEYERLRKAHAAPRAAVGAARELRASGARRSSGARKICPRPSLPACACSMIFRWPRCANTLTGRRSSTRGAEGRLSAHSGRRAAQGAQARQIFAEANALLDRMIMRRS